MHSAGPWTFDELTDEWKWYQVSIFDADGNNVCSSEHPLLNQADHKAALERARANKRLITAAPEMIETLLIVSSDPQVPSRIREIALTLTERILTPE